MRSFLLVVALLITTSAYADDPLTPNPTLTPGAVFNPPTPLSELCKSGHTKVVRHVTPSTKAWVFREYGYDPKATNRDDYEIDHLIPLSLDGSNDVKNLWPESYISRPVNAHVKDELEDKLHRMVCSGEIDLQTAQQAIASDWQAAYQKYVLGN